MSRVTARTIYFAGALLDHGIIFAFDPAPQAGVDNFASFCKMTVFEAKGGPNVRLVELRKPRRYPGDHRRSAILQRGPQRMSEGVRSVSQQLSELEW